MLIQIANTDGVLAVPGPVLSIFHALFYSVLTTAPRDGYYHYPELEKLRLTEIVSKGKYASFYIFLHMLHNSDVFRGEMHFGETIFTQP